MAVVPTRVIAKEDKGVYSSFLIDGQEHKFL